MADAPKEPTQAELDAEKAQAKATFHEWLNEAMDERDKKAKAEAEAEAKKNPPRNESGNGSQAAPRRQNGLQKLLNL